ncbi:MULTISPECIES: DUF11 domain-containing protein [unclassified Streptomyces]|uniref:DUF11 domain-containing protein n=1 Tax=unclassified Streptomyces TaxID=2593676 RepID=UPI000DB9F146|nr:MULTISPECIES: DUF11 domain-containing protein [unclassified Streptomyces]MYT73449.1 DUF11 domain-containing protein [Streptomyces sp. SID8367]RAJ84978.1 uncharacterized protein DUF11 [Streptomyces sp. PsTaAH-137]
MSHDATPRSRTRRTTLAALLLTTTVTATLAVAGSASAASGDGHQAPRAGSTYGGYDGDYGKGWTDNYRYDKDYGKPWGGGVTDKQRIADVAVTASGPRQLDHNQEQRWVVEFTNKGSATAKNVRSSTTMPNGIRYLAHRISEGHASETLTSDGRIVLSIGDLAPGRTVRLEIAGRAPSYGGGTVQLSTSVTASGPERTTGNNTAVVQTRIA